MKIAVCDDDRKILDRFEEMVKERYHDDIQLALFTSSDGLIEACRTIEFDMIFVDILLDGRDGIKMAGDICHQLPEVKIVFITAYVLRYAEEIFKGVEPYGFIGKPIDAEKVYYYIDRLEQKIAQANRRLRLSQGGVPFEICLSDVWYIESDRRQVHFHCGIKDISVYEKLDDIEEQLDERFVRCHQSYIVNLEYVVRLEGDNFVMRNLPNPDDIKAQRNDPRMIKISRKRLQESRESYFGYKGRAVL